MTDLIQRLNALVGNTPDEIARKLNNNGWMKPSELGSDRFHRDKDTVRYAYCQVLANGRRGTLNTDWRMCNCTNGYSYFVKVLETDTYERTAYWIIPFSEYQEGSLPPCTT